MGSTTWSGAIAMITVMRKARILKAAAIIRVVARSVGGPSLAETLFKMANELRRDATNDYFIGVMSVVRCMGLVRDRMSRSNNTSAKDIVVLLDMALDLIIVE